MEEESKKEKNRWLWKADLNPNSKLSLIQPWWSGEGGGRG